MINKLIVNIDLVIYDIRGMLFDYLPVILICFAIPSTAERIKLSNKDSIK